MKPERKPFLAGLLGALLVLVVGAAGVNSLQRYSDWDNGYAGAGGIWTRLNNAPDRAGIWSNKLTAASLTIPVGDSFWVILDGGGDQLLFSNTISGGSVIINQQSGIIATNFYAYKDITARQYLSPYTNNFVATNVAGSNITLTATGPYKHVIYATNNLTFTNFVGMATGTNGSWSVDVYPQLIPRGVLFPTFGGNQYGVHFGTNPNQVVFTTITNAVLYNYLFEFTGTNIKATVTAWF